MSDTDADAKLKNQTELESKRANWDSFWDDIARRVLPASATFETTTEEGQRKTERVFDATAITANERFAAWIGESYTPRDQIWHGLEAEEEELRDDQEIKEFWDRVVKLLFAVRYRPFGNFNSQRYENYLGLGAFGNYSTLIDEEVGQGIRYRAIPMHESYWAENHQGIIDTYHRKFELHARQAVQKFREKCPPKIAKEAATGNPYKLFTFLHCVSPNEERVGGRRDYTGMPWGSYYVSYDEKTTVARGGYWTWPYAIGRFMKAPRETYARSPAMSAFPSIMTANEQKKTVLRAGQKIVDPPVLCQEDGVLEAFNMRAGAMNYGYLSDQGEPLIVPFETKGRVDIGVDLMALEQKAINDAFMVSLFQILAEQPQMTATEVLSRLQEKATLLSPATGRLESEDAGPMIERELDILARAGMLPPMPEQLREAGGGFKVIYTSPLSKARRAGDALAITRTMEIATLAVGLDPRARHVLNVEESLREVADINGVPAKLLRSTDEVDALIQQDNAMQMAAAAAEAAPKIAGAAKDAASASQIRQETAA